MQRKGVRKLKKKKCKSPCLIVSFTQAGYIMADFTYEIISPFFLLFFFFLMPDHHLGPYQNERTEREWDSSQLHHSATQWPEEDVHNGCRLMEGVILKSVDSLQREEECLFLLASCLGRRDWDDLKKKILTTCQDTNSTLNIP